MSCGFFNCSMQAKKNGNDYFTQGMRIQWESEGTNGHSASELRFHECSFNGDVHIWIDHNQSASIEFTGRTYAADYHNTNRRCPTIWLDSPCSFTFEVLRTDGKGTIFGFGWMPKVKIGNIFIDQAFHSLLDTNNQQTGSLTINGGQINFRSPLPGHASWLCRVANSGTSPVITFNDTLAAEGPVRASQPYPYKLTVLSERSNLLGSLTVIEPSAEQWPTLGGAAVTWDKPGIKLPDSTVTVGSQVADVLVNGASVPVPIQGETAVVVGATINGLTSAPQVHQRLAWE